MSIFSRSKKKDMDYFEAFIKMADGSLRAAKEFKSLMDDYTDIETKADKIHAIEHECDEIHHEIIRQLNQSFITPIDREDIISIASELDTITDNIEDAANLFVIFSIDTVSEPAKEFSVLIIECCEAVHKALSEFRSFKSVKGSKSLKETIILVNDIEEKGDRLYRKTVKELYLSKQDTLEIVKWKEIYDTLEDVLDSCEDVANLAEGLAIKNT